MIKSRGSRWSKLEATPQKKMERSSKQIKHFDLSDNTHKIKLLCLSTYINGKIR